MRSQGLVVLALLALISPVLLAAPSLELKRGMPVSEALEHLRSAGLRIIYSSSVVTPSMRLTENVRDTDTEALAQAILRPHGLMLRRLDSHLLAVVASARVQRWTVTGDVLSQDDLQPVSGARVELVGLTHVAWTDSRGAFSLDAIGNTPAGIKVSAPGFRTHVLALGAPTQPQRLNVLLVSVQPQLEEVAVVASRIAYEEEPAGSFMLDQRTILAQPKLADDALQATARLPGMALSGVSARPNVRGGEVGETMVLLDGMPIREAFHLAEYNSAFSAIDDSLVARLTAYTGSLPLRFGNRLSSIMELESVGGDQPSHHAIGINNFNARLRTGGGEQSGSGLQWVAAGRVGTLGSWLQQTSPDLGIPQSSDAFAKAQYRGASGGELRAEGLWAQSKFTYLDADTGENAQLHGESAYLWLTGSHPFADRGNVSFLLGYSRLNSLRRGELALGLNPSGSLRDRRSTNLWDLSINATSYLGAAHWLEAGANFASGRGKYNYSAAVRFDPVAQRLFGLPASRTRSTAQATNSDLFGFYVQDRWQWHPAIYLELGARIERAAADMASQHFNPRLSMLWRVSKTTDFRIGLSRAHQSPEAHEVRVEDGEATLPFAQRIDQGVASLERRFQSGVVLRLEAYERRVPAPRVRYENLFDPLRLMPELSADRVTIRPQSSRTRGIELTGQWERGGWSLWGAYSWSKATDRIADQSIPREWDQRHNLVLSATLQRGPWILSAQSAWHSGRPTTPLLNDSLQSPQLGSRASQRFKSYLSIDARVARRVTMRHGTLVAFAQLTNMLGRFNSCCVEVDLPDETSDPTRLEIQGLGSYPLVPSLGINYEF